MRNFRKLKFRKGFTIVEMLIAVAIFSLVIGAIILMQQTSEKTYRSGGIKIEMQQNARAVLDLIGGELREIGSDPENIIGVPFGSVTPIRLEFMSDKQPGPDNRIGDGDINDPGEHVVYFLDVDNDILYRRDFAKYPEGHEKAGQEMYPNPIELIDNVQNFQFTYFKYDSTRTQLVQFTPVTGRDKFDIVNIGINVELASSEKGSDATFELQSTASLRDALDWTAAAVDVLAPVAHDMAPAVKIDIADTLGNPQDTLFCGENYDLGSNAFDEESGLVRIDVYWVNSTTGDSFLLDVFYPGDASHVSSDDTISLGGEVGTVGSDLFNFQGSGPTGEMTPLSDLPINCCEAVPGEMVAIAYDDGGNVSVDSREAFVDCESPYLNNESDTQWDNLPNTIWHDDFGDDSDWGNQSGTWEIVEECYPPGTSPPAPTPAPGTCVCGGGNTYRQVSPGGGSHGFVTIHNSTSSDFTSTQNTEYTVYIKFRNKDNGLGITSPHSNIAFWCDSNGSNCTYLEYQGNAGLFLDGGSCTQSGKAPNTGNLFAPQYQWIYMALGIYDLDATIPGVEIYGHVWCPAAGTSLPDDPRNWQLTPSTIQNYGCFVSQANKWGGVGIVAKKGMCADEMVTFVDNTLTSGGGSANPVCGNGVCDPGENSGTCPGDCMPGGGSNVCGNGVCEGGETATNCPADCGSGCAANGDPCTISGDCCSGNCVVTCAQAGEYCDSDDDCCGGDCNPGKNECKNDGPESGICQPDPTALPQVTIELMNDGSEVGPADGKFKISRVGGDQTVDLDVSLLISGTVDAADYSASPSLSGSVTIPAGNYYQIITITPIDEGIAEGDETLILEVGPWAGAYTIGSPSTATMTITDAGLPKVSIIATDPSASETGPVPGALRISRTGPTTSDLVVEISVSGTADPSDYSETISSTWTIPAGSADSDITITPINDSSTEGEETVIIDLNTSVTYDIDPTYNSGTVKIADAGSPPLPVVTVEAIDSPVNEAGGKSAIFRFTQNNSIALSSLSVEYSITYSSDADVSDFSSSPDLTAGGGMIDIPSSGTADIVITPYDDTIIEQDQQITVTLYELSPSTYTVGIPGEATVTIVDDDKPTVTIQAVNTPIDEDASGSAIFRFSHDGPYGVTVYYTDNTGGGSGIVSSDDYTASPSLSGSVNVPSGTTVEIAISPVDDTTDEPDEILTITLATSGNYAIGTASATITIIDNDVSGPVCGNGTCEAGEDHANCPSDCPCVPNHGYCDENADCCSGNCNTKANKCK